MDVDVTIKRLEGHQFDVVVRQGSSTTQHRVQLPAGMADDHRLAGVDHDELVRESFAFLLEREPATSILPEFDLDVIGRYFPEYPEEIAKRVSRRA